MELMAQVLQLQDDASVTIQRYCFEIDNTFWNVHMHNQKWKSRSYGQQFPAPHNFASFSCIILKNQISQELNSTHYSNNVPSQRLCIIAQGESELFFFNSRPTTNTAGP